MLVNYSLGQPGLLWLLVPLGLLVALYVLGPRVSEQAIKNTLAISQSRVSNSRGPLRHSGAAAILLTMTLAVFLLADVQTTSVSAEPARRSPITVALDTSETMTADDVKPTRLGAAKQAATRWVESAPADQPIGLVLFAGEPVSSVLPTLDHKAVLDAIKAAKVSLIKGTATGEAVVRAIEDRAIIAGATGITYQHCNILLISDGLEQLADDTTFSRLLEPANGKKSAVQQAKQADCRLHTVSMGMPNGYNLNGEVVYANPEALQAAAKQTEGAHSIVEEASKLGLIFDELPTEPVVSNTEQIGLPLPVRLAAGALYLLGLLAFCAYPLRGLGRSFMRFAVRQTRNSHHEEGDVSKTTTFVLDAAPPPSA